MTLIYGLRRRSPFPFAAFAEVLDEVVDDVPGRRRGSWLYGNSL